MLSNDWAAQLIGVVEILVNQEKTPNKHAKNPRPFFNDRGF